MQYDFLYSVFTLVSEIEVTYSYISLRCSYVVLVFPFIPKFQNLQYLEKYVMLCAIYYHLYSFKKHEKHSWRSLTFITLLHGCFSNFCLNDLTGVKTFKKVAVVNTPFLFCYSECIRELFLI